MTRYVLYACVLLAGTLAAGPLTAAEPAEQIQLAPYNLDSDSVAPDAVVATEAAESWDALASAALYEPDDALRAEAIHDVGLQRHADAAAVLVQVAAYDLEPDNRLQAVELLWYLAADGLDDGAITATLQTALDDPDEGVAAMAGQAMADLAALAAAQ